MIHNCNPLPGYREFLMHKPHIHTQYWGLGFFYFSTPPCNHAAGGQMWLVLLVFSSFSPAPVLPPCSQAALQCISHASAIWGPATAAFKGSEWLVTGCQLCQSPTWLCSPEHSPPLSLSPLQPCPDHAHLQKQYIPQYVEISLIALPKCKDQGAKLISQCFQCQYYNNIIGMTLSLVQKITSLIPT